jgi:hypothetical protein
VDVVLLFSRQAEFLHASSTPDLTRPGGHQWELSKENISIIPTETRGSVVTHHAPIFGTWDDWIDVGKPPTVCVTST